jgi:hypothetical protein
VAGPRGVCLTAALLVAVGSAMVSCGGPNPASDFCSSYGDAVRGVVSAAHQYTADPAAFSNTYKSTMDGMGKIRAKAPDDELRSAFDRSMFTFSVFSSDADLADFLNRADFSGNAVVLACADHGAPINL